ncbi:MAG: hypothetical protein IJ383_07080 [Bacteroidales bacterium]|nr:hypothetical protein [Bacteroidales bacterium]
MRFIVLLFMLVTTVDCTLTAQQKMGRRAEKKQRDHILLPEIQERE